MNNEQRNLMVKRVQETYAKWPTFESMPVVEAAGLTGYTIEGDIKDNSEYIAALYDLSRDVTPVGRAKSANIVYGKSTNAAGSSLDINRNTKQQQNPSSKGTGKRVG